MIMHEDIYLSTQYFHLLKNWIVRLEEPHGKLPASTAVFGMVLVLKKVIVSSWLRAVELCMFIAELCGN